MSESGKHPGIVVGVDGSEGSKVALRWAARDAQLRGVPLTLVHAHAGGGWTRGPHGRDHHVVEDAMGIIADTPGGNSVRVESEIASGSAASTMVALSERAS